MAGTVIVGAQWGDDHRIPHPMPVGPPAQDEDAMWEDASPSGYGRPRPLD